MPVFQMKRWIHAFMQCSYYGYAVRGFQEVEHMAFIGKAAQALINFWALSGDFESLGKECGEFFQSIDIAACLV